MIINLCNWLGGIYEIDDILIYDKIKKIYDSIIDLDDFDIKVNLIWVKAHNNEQLNELADDMAKFGMMNLYNVKNGKIVI